MDWLRPAGVPSNHESPKRDRETDKITIAPNSRRFKTNDDLHQHH
jgi:hypothetical protein